jgi:endoglucanase Acf2
MRRGLAIALVLAGCSGPGVDARSPSAPPDPATSQAVGAGFYMTANVEGEPLPGNEKGVPVQPKVTADFAGHPTSNDWWSSLIWQFDRGGKPNPYSEPMWPHPLAVQAEKAGLAVAYPTEVVVEKQAYRHPFTPDLLVGAVGIASPDTRVARYSDWTVTASWSGGADSAAAPADTPRDLRITIGHGLPFVYVETTGGRPARVELRGKASVWHQGGEVFGVTVRGHHYALFAPTGARWIQDGEILRAELGKDDFYSVAILPDREARTLDRFREHAYAFVTGSEVSWAYEPAKGRVATTFKLPTQLRQAGEDPRPLTALYRHQWQNMSVADQQTALVGGSYASPRGQMKLAVGPAVTARFPYTGVVPSLPLVDGVDKDAVVDLVDDAWRRGDYVPPGMDGKKDSYWVGKALQRLAILVHMADQVGHTKARDAMLRAMQNELEDWFDGRQPYLFFYEKSWHTLIGSPSAYMSGGQLNDHHFHYGYFVFAAATVAQFDPAWAAPERYGAMVELLIRDAATWDRQDERFPFLRNFDPYAGHSWANGPALFPNGNNEESSSEDVNFATGLVLWGAATGNTAIRDLGAYLYANLTVAIEQYWFDVDNEVFPKDFARPTIAILWGDGGRYDTWWDPSPVYVHGINFLPVTGGSMYLARRVDYARANWKGLVEANRGEPLQWRDVHWMYLAISDPELAARKWAAAASFKPEYGNSPAAVYHWIQTLRVAGPLDPTVTADHATAFVLRKGDQRTYVATNPGPGELDVRFSDGTRLTVPARTTTHVRQQATGGTR